MCRTEARKLAVGCQAIDGCWAEVEVRRNRYLAISHGPVMIPLVASKELTCSVAHQLTQPLRHLLQQKVENAPADERRGMVYGFGSCRPSGGRLHPEEQAEETREWRSLPCTPTRTGPRIGEGILFSLRCLSQ